MLYLVIDQNNIPLHKWSIQPDVDFVGQTVIGPALTGADGKPVDSAALSIVNGSVVIDQAKLAALQAKLDQEKQARANKIIAADAAVKALAAFDSASIRSLPDLVNAFNQLLIAQGFK